MINRKQSIVGRVRMIINGRPVIAQGNDNTVIFDHGSYRCSVTTRNGNVPLTLTTEPDEEAEIYDAGQRVREAAARPFTPRSERPSSRVAAARRLAREYHSAVWGHGYAEGQARYEARSLSDRVTAADIPELIEMAGRAILGDQELRDQFRAAADAAEVEEALSAELAS
jgi:hypothetical protein